MKYHGRSIQVLLFGALWFSFALVACDDEGKELPDTAPDSTVEDTESIDTLGDTAPSDTREDTRPEDTREDMVPSDTADASEDSADGEVEDAGDTDVLGDATDAQDAADVTDVPTGPPLRTLVPLGPPAGSPLRNRIFRPALEGDRANVAVLVPPVDTSYPGYGVAFRHVFARTPRPAPVLEAPAAENPDGALVSMTAIFGEGMHSVSVWLGRRLGDADAGLETVSVGISGFRADATTSEPIMTSVDLVREDASYVELEGIGWYRFYGWTDAFVGRGHLMVLQPPDGTDLLVHAPVALHLDDFVGAAMAPAPYLQPRDLTPMEGNALAGLARLDRERPTPPMTPFTAPKRFMVRGPIPTLVQP